MFSIPHSFSDESEGYITIPALKKFAKNIDKAKTSVIRSELISEIEKFAQQSDENKETVLEWLDQVVAEGIKDIKIKFLNLEMSDPSIIDDTLLESKLKLLIDSDEIQHFCGCYTKDLKLFRYQISSSDAYGKIIKLYLGKLIYSFEKKSMGWSATQYPIFVEVYLDKKIIVARAKSKSNMYEYPDSDDLNPQEYQITTTTDKQIEEAIDTVGEWLGLKFQSSLSSAPKFKHSLYKMLERYSYTPKEISELMENKTEEIDKVVDIISKDICGLKPRYRDDVSSSIRNIIEKYFSITYPQKDIFIKDRDAYPLKLIATDEEESKIEQTAASNEPLQSKAIFFDNKKMIQKNKACDGIYFRFRRKNSQYFQQWFKVKILIKKDSCILKFTEYTMEEDIINVLFSLIIDE